MKTACFVCHKVFRDMETMERHAEKKHPDEPLPVDGLTPRGVHQADQIVAAAKDIAKKAAETGRDPEDATVEVFEELTKLLDVDPEEVTDDELAAWLGALAVLGVLTLLAGVA